MTRNLFLGADLRPVYAALSERLADVPDAVAGVLGMVQRTDFPARARAIAGEIEAARPDLIGLQEAAVWRSSSYEADNLELLEAELASRGLEYRRVATVTNGEVELRRRRRSPTATRSSRARISTSPTPPQAPSPTPCASAPRAASSP